LKDPAIHIITGSAKSRNERYQEDYYEELYKETSEYLAIFQVVLS